MDDNPALVEAAKQKIPFIAFTIFPTKTTTVAGLSSISDARANAIHQALESLHASLEATGIGLLVVQTIQELALSINPSEIHTVYYNDYPGTTEQHQLSQLQELFKQSIFHASKSYSMIHPHQLGFSINDLPDVFTNFRKQVEKNIVIASPLNTPKFIQTDIQYSLPSLKSLGFNETLLLIPSGEEYALERLRYYCIESGHVRTYKDTRNGMLEWDDSSKLSMHLALGTLSARRVYATLKESEQLYGANESTYWLWFELLWRDFFYFTHLKEQQSFFQPWDLPTTLTPYQQERFSAILSGTTGYPLVDANMKELVKTGWMSNRGRQNVASFFVHYCKLPWSLGATMFESFLLDYNVSSNVGNWRYVAGVGNDPRDHRIFNVMKQGTQYDASTQYILRWLPQLYALPIHQRYRVNQLSNSQRTAIDYPHPIVGLPWQ
jgi:deoxyribodipyrimidine photo-lyase